MKMPQNMKNINVLLTVVSACKDDVIIRSSDGSEEYSLKTALSQLIGIAKVCEDNGEEYEVCCLDPEDEIKLKGYFVE